MLTGLTIRNVVLVDQIDLSFENGLSVLTGETGAGKSILLDALGLALGERSEARLVRHGADQASVTASFDPPIDHPCRAIVRDRGIDHEGHLLLRRVVSKDGRSRAYINDEPISIGLLRQMGDLLVEIHGQFEQRGLLDVSTHRNLLDSYAGLQKKAETVNAMWGDLHAAREALEAAEAAAASAREDEDYLRHAFDELNKLAPEAEEEESLLIERQRLTSSGKLIEALGAARDTLNGRTSVEEAITKAQRVVERVRASAPELIDPLLVALDKAADEIADTLRLLDAAGSSLDAEPNRLEAVDDRLFALRDAARKYRCTIPQLVDFQEKTAQQLAAIEDRSTILTERREALAMAQSAYREQAEKLSQDRHSAARKLDKAVAAELLPLKLEKARFTTQIDPLAEENWGGHGLDAVSFRVATNPGAEAGPINKIASGGELARFMLALKVVLARGGSAPTLVFDEVDAGIGGATAAAVGERLSRLGQSAQVLVVTHSPQVAARADGHWRVEKGQAGESMATDVSRLSEDDRCEEIARMLSGQDITDEARAAAAVLIAGGG